MELREKLFKKLAELRERCKNCDWFNSTEKHCSVEKHKGTACLNMQEVIVFLEEALHGTE